MGENSLVDLNSHRSEIICLLGSDHKLNFVYNNHIALKIFRLTNRLVFYTKFEWPQVHILSRTPKKTRFDNTKAKLMIIKLKTESENKFMKES